MDVPDADDGGTDRDDSEHDEKLPGFGLFVGLVSLLTTGAVYRFLSR